MDEVDRRLIEEAQEVLDEHSQVTAAGYCATCNVMHPCPPALAARRVFFRFSALPKRTVRERPTT